MARQYSHNAGSYTVIGTINDANYQGSATNTLVIAQAGATVTLGNLNRLTAVSAEVATASHHADWIDGEFFLQRFGPMHRPTRQLHGDCTIIIRLYRSATNTLVIAQASGAVTLGSLSQTYNGSGQAGDGNDDSERIGGELYVQRFS